MAANAFTVDSTRLFTDYQNGDFEKIEPALKPILQPGAVGSRMDSLLAWKYLSVVYAANPKTREKGRYCMMRLLDTDPAADLLELYVSEDVYEIFSRARQEHALTWKTGPAIAVKQTEASEESDEETESGEAPEEEIEETAVGSGRPNKWLVSALTVAAVAGLTWYSFENTASDDPLSKPQ